MPDGPLSPPARLSLPARLCLLAWEPAHRTAEGPASLGRMVRAGALAAAVRLGLLADVDSIVTPVDADAFTGDPVLDGLLELVEESRPRGWGAWVSLHTGVTLDAVCAQLADTGHLRRDRRRVLKVFPAVGYALADASLAAALRAEALGVLRGSAPASEVPEADAVFVVLAAAADGGDPADPALVTDEERARSVPRIDALTERGAASAPALRKVLREVSAAVAVPA